MRKASSNQGLVSYNDITVIPLGGVVVGVGVSMLGVVVGAAVCMLGVVVGVRVSMLGKLLGTIDQLTNVQKCSRRGHLERHEKGLAGEKVA